MTLVTDTRAELRHKIRLIAQEEYERARGTVCRQKTLDFFEALGEWHYFAIRREVIQGRDDDVLELHRTFPQMFRALGLPGRGSVKEDRRFYRNSMARRLDYAVEMGWLHSWQEAPKAANGEGTGILLRLRRDSSVGRAIRRILAGRSHGPTPSSPRFLPGWPAPRRDAPRPSRSSFSGDLAPPFSENTEPRAPTCSSSSEAVEHGSGRARLPREEAIRVGRAHSQRRALRDRARAALTIRQRLGEDIGDGTAVLAELPWLAQVHPVDLARIAWELSASDRDAGLDTSSTFGPGRAVISPRWQRHLEVAVRQLDRTAAGRGDGFGHAAILMVCAGEWRHYRRQAPYSLGGVAFCMRRWAREWRRHARVRRDRSYVDRSLALEAGR